jgi:predicted ABC-type ATPase
MMSLLNEKRQKELLIKKNKLIVSEKFRGGYTAALISDFLRHRMLDLKKSFSFETVMSHKSKIEIIQKSKTLGYTVNLIFVSTNNPSINVERVNLRVQKGGHNVDEQKICDRYYRCMDLLFDAFLLADNAYVFDNSYMKQSFNDRLVATKTGKEIVLSENVCEWFEKYVLDKINKK